LTQFIRSCPIAHGGNQLYGVLTGRKSDHIAATGVHAVYSILPGPGKDFWPVKTTRRGNREGFVTKFMISKFIHEKM
jgi:hypothetical protein